MPTGSASTGAHARHGIWVSPTPNVVVRTKIRRQPTTTQTLTVAGPRQPVSFRPDTTGGHSTAALLSDVLGQGGDNGLTGTMMTWVFFDPSYRRSYVTRRPVLASAPMARSLLVAGLSPEAREQASYPVDSPHWQTWANPEFMQHDIRLLLEFQDQHIRDLVLELVKASLSESGYELARTLMRINGVLGDIVGLPALMNDYSYNFALYGTPSHTEPWGWQLFGHHLAVNCSVAVTQMVITPIFFRRRTQHHRTEFPKRVAGFLARHRR